MRAPKAARIITKRALIDKANTTTLVAAGIAAFLLVFSLVSAKALVTQLSYQNRVIGAKKETLKTVDENLEARDSLVKSYRSFIGGSTNIIGGSQTGSEDRDGDNGTIILDALPSKYDYPALTASLEKLAIKQTLKIEGITGTDDEVAQSSQQVSATPKAVPIVYVLSVNGGYAQLQELIRSFESSIRPIQVQSLEINASESEITADISAQTFYQSEKKLELTKKVVK